MGSFHKYPHIESLFRVPDIFHESEVVVTEKIHGANVRCGFVEDRFRVGGRNEELDLESSNANAGMGFLGWLRATDIPARVKALAEELGKDITFYGEWHGPSIQKGVRYSETKDFRLFDVRVDEDLVSWDEVIEFAERIGVRTVPVLYRGKPSETVFDDLRIIPSRTAFDNGVGSEENIVEGVVIKPVYMRRDSRGNWIIAKHKNPRFEERKSLQRGEKPKLEIPQTARDFVEEFITPQRLEHVLGRLRESGVDVMSSSAIGPAIREMYVDATREAGPDFENLPEEAQKAFGKIHSGRTKALLAAYVRENSE